jgi:thioesterase domain-containing protein
MFAGVGGTPEISRELAAELGDDRPIYGFHYIGALGECEPASIPFHGSGSVFDPLYGWRDFVRGRIDTQVVPGEHLHMFRRENGELLAELLRQRLVELQEPRPL